MGLFTKKTTNKVSSDSDNDSTITLDNGDVINITRTIDCLGFSCPRPQLMAKGAMNDAKSGDIIKIVIDNPTSMESLASMQSELNSIHLGTVFSDQSWKVLLQRN
ncbi:sulfurtransferase TusA family protein [Candidatus Thioglobus sp.]|jgi:tRNA 2-thiouridine synthesizing protein A|uniref:sulfurtransferase TusA family protein n=1 Tax=Candidatus Thioglobus sp. TaxID=2026721 RepID=UPI0025B7B627|nr:sulfurtransferase TusA family protein [Candidatus Thioglobus sp.]MBT3276520.1 sulfurtransferase TusA family protein [Candidatus Thioglobus sp.]